MTDSFDQVNTQHLVIKWTTFYKLLCIARPLFLSDPIVCFVIVTSLIWAELELGGFWKIWTSLQSTWYAQFSFFHHRKIIFVH